MPTNSVRFRAYGVYSTPNYAARVVNAAGLTYDPADGSFKDVAYDPATGSFGGGVDPLMPMSPEGPCVAALGLVLGPAFADGNYTAVYHDLSFPDRRPVGDRNFAVSDGTADFVTANVYKLRWHVANTAVGDTTLVGAVGLLLERTAKILELLGPKAA